MLSYVNGWGKEHVKIYNFNTNQDGLKVNLANDSALLTPVTAAYILTGVLGVTVQASDIFLGSATATFTYNGDTFFIGDPYGNNINTTFEDGEVVFQFVGVTDISGSDITGF